MVVLVSVVVVVMIMMMVIVTDSKGRFVLTKDVFTPRHVKSKKKQE